MTSALDLGVGLGIRPELFNTIITERPRLAFLEAHAENYFAPSINRELLFELADDYPISLHGVGLSLGRADALDQEHLRHLKQLVAGLDPILVSEHLAWNAFGTTHLPDLLPVPLSRTALELVCQHVDQVQQLLGRQILIENPSNYLRLDASVLAETDFLNCIAARTGCGILLDVNNVYVSACNCNGDAEAYLTGIESSAIGQYHLAGHQQSILEGQSVLIDTHNTEVDEKVWGLFKHTLKTHGRHPTLVEWDSDFPEWSTLMCEVDTAKQIIAGATETTLDAITDNLSLERTTSGQAARDLNSTSFQLAQFQQDFLRCVLQREEAPTLVEADYAQRVRVYWNNTRSAIQDYMQEVYPAVHGVVGEAYFNQMVLSYLQLMTPRDGNIHNYGEDFAVVLNKDANAENMPYLDDLIAYEWALHKCYFSQASNLPDPAKLFAADQGAQVELNPSVHLLQTKYPILKIHQQSLPDYEGKVFVDLEQGGENLLVFKQHQRVMTVPISSDLVSMVKQFEKSANLLQSIEGLTGSFGEETVRSNLGFVIESQLLSISNNIQ